MDRFGTRAPEAARRFADEGGIRQHLDVPDVSADAAAEDRARNRALGALLRITDEINGFDLDGGEFARRWRDPFPTTRTKTAHAALRASSTD